MKNNYQEIIDKFGEGRIGDVLNYIDELDSKKYYAISPQPDMSLLYFWKKVGLLKPLSEILRDELRWVSVGKMELSPKATELFQFLKTL